MLLLLMRPMYSATFDFVLQLLNLEGQPLQLTSAPGWLLRPLVDRTRSTTKRFCIEDAFNGLSSAIFESVYNTFTWLVSGNFSITNNEMLLPPVRKYPFSNPHFTCVIRTLVQGSRYLDCISGGRLAAAAAGAGAPPFAAGLSLARTLISFDRVLASNGVHPIERWNEQL